MLRSLRLTAAMAAMSSRDSVASTIKTGPATHCFGDQVPPCSLNTVTNRVSKLVRDKTVARQRTVLGAARVCPTGKLPDRSVDSDTVAEYDETTVDDLEVPQPQWQHVTDANPSWFCAPDRGGDWYFIAASSLFRAPRSRLSVGSPPLPCRRRAGIVRDIRMSFMGQHSLAE